MERLMVKGQDQGDEPYVSGVSRIATGVESENVSPYEARAVIRVCIWMDTRRGASPRSDLSLRLNFAAAQIKDW